MLQDDREKIEIFISCRTLKDKDVFSKSDPQAFVYSVSKNKQLVKIGQTEVIQNNLNPNFSTTITTDFIFEIQQNLKFEVVDYDGPNQYEFLGECFVQLSTLVGARNQTSILPLQDKHGKQTNQKIILRCEKVGTCREEIFFQLQGKKLRNKHWFGTPSPFLQLLRTREDKQQLKVYNTEHVKNNLNPIFKPVKMKISKLCNADYHLPIIVEYFEYKQNGSHAYVASTSFTLDQVIKQGQKKFILKAKSGKDSGEIYVTNAVISERFEFVDFLRGGMQLNLITAIDFTGSNGIPTQPSSLHAINLNGPPNQYQKALQAVGNILIDYDYNKQVGAFGFGGKPKLPNFQFRTVQHCFPLTGNPQSSCVSGIYGLLQAYQFMLSNCELSGPTCFAPMITEAMKAAEMNKMSNTNIYSILLILTDGIIHDMKETKSKIVQAAFLPLSIIIVGIGQEDFSAMEVLDGDDGLWDDQGNKAKRDLVQFVPFNKFAGNQEALAQEVLYELPNQVVEYHAMIGVKPNKVECIAIDQITGTGFNEQVNQLGVNLGTGGFLQGIVQQAVGQPQSQMQPQQMQPQQMQPQQMQPQQMQQPNLMQSQQQQQQIFPPQFAQQMAQQFINQSSNQGAYNYPTQY